MSRSGVSDKRPLIEEERPPSASVIRVQGLRKSYDGVVAVREFSLDVAENEVVALLGPSGCGKTTTLRSIAGLLEPDEGHIEVDSRVVFSSDRGISLPPERRGLSMVFQQYALWPHMDVFENVAFGLRVRNTSKSDVERMVQDALRQVQLWEKRDRRVSELSGGQQQRIALARAIAFHPRVVLFDEPLSNLDAKLRDDMRFELMEIQKRLGFTAVYVTHDQSEAISLASRIVIMNHGVVEQVDTPRGIWLRPASGFVARFVGSTNRLEGVIAEVDAAEDTLRVTSSDGVDVTVTTSQFLGNGLSPSRGLPVELYVKNGDVHVSDPVEGVAGPNSWETTLDLVSFSGDATVLRFRIGETTFTARAAAETELRDGDRVVMSIDPSAIACFPLSHTKGGVPEETSAASE